MGWQLQNTNIGLIHDISGFTQASVKSLPRAQRRGGQKMWKGGISPHLRAPQQQDALPGSLGMSLDTGPSRLSALFALLELFHRARWRRIAVAEKQKESLFNKGCSKGLNGLKLHFANITENMRTDNQVRAEVQRALCPASTWPKCFVVSSLSLFLFIAPEHFGLSTIFCLFFCLVGMVLWSSFRGV